MPSTFSKLFLSSSLFAFGAKTLEFPATVEIDLVFPRNDTYAPVPLIPIVFAVQNSRFASLIQPYIQFDFTSNTNLSKVPVSAIVDLTYANFSSSDPYYAWNYIAGLNGIEGQWRLSWSLFTSNCSTSTESILPNITTQTQGTDVIIFTTRNGTQPPDLVAASADSTCASTSESYTFNLTGTLDVWNKDNFNGQNSCAIIPPGTPTANPCGAAINSATASRISSAITSAACALQLQSVTCPPINNSVGSVSLFPGWWFIYIVFAVFGVSF